MLPTLADGRGLLLAVSNKNSTEMMTVPVRVSRYALPEAVHVTSLADPETSPAPTRLSRTALPFPIPPWPRLERKGPQAGVFISELVKAVSQHTMKQSFVVILIIALLSACSPGAPAPTPASQPTTEALTAEATVAPTLDPTLTAMIIETSGSNTNVHDPTMIKEGSMYYLFSTGAGIPIRCSKDMKVWESCGRVFDANPDWAVKAIEGVKDLWAPDIIIHNGKYYLYYAASTFGNNRSTIGLATNTSLDPKSPNYAWEDQGEVISS
jgi:hypothetical protein